MSEPFRFMVFHMNCLQVSAFTKFSDLDFA